MSGFQVLYDDESEEEEEEKPAPEPPAKSPAREAWLGIPEPTNEDNIYIVRGKEKMKHFGEKVVSYGFKGKHSQFWGKCFLCLCSGHSQRFCPLKYCQRCDDYGHSIVVCPYEESNLRAVRHNLRQKPVHPSVTSKNWRRRAARHPPNH